MHFVAIREYFSCSHHLITPINNIYKGHPALPLLLIILLIYKEELI